MPEGLTPLQKIYRIAARRYEIIKRGEATDLPVSRYSNTADLGCEMGFIISVAFAALSEEERRAAAAGVAKEVEEWIERSKKEDWS